MKRVISLVAIFLLVVTAYAEISPQTPIDICGDGVCSASEGKSFDCLGDCLGEIDVVLAFAQTSCADTPDGFECDLPKSLGKGVCCSNVCIFNESICREREVTNNIGYMKQSPAKSKIIEDEFSADNLFNNKFTHGSNKDSEEKIAEEIAIQYDACGDGICSLQEESKKDCPTDCQKIDIDPTSLMEKIAIFSCIGYDDGNVCELPQDLIDEFSLSGVCCSGRCQFRKTKCPDTKMIEMPDLMLSSVSIKPEKPMPQKDIEIKYTIKNTGKVDVTEDFYVQLTIKKDDNIVLEESLPFNGILKPAMERRLSHKFQLTNAEPGSYRVIVMADRDTNFNYRNNLINESNEENNAGSKVIQLVKPMEKAICGDERCSQSENATSCPNDCEKPKDSTSNMTTEIFLFFLLLVGGICITLVIVVLILKRREKLDPSAENLEKTIMELNSERKELVRMTELAKEKYYRRELDGESFREIARDNQVKILGLEMKISQIDGRVDRLEDEKDDKK